MDGLCGGIRAVEIMLRGGFFMFLAVSAFQDYRVRRIRISLFVTFGIAGSVLRGIQLVLELGALSGNWGIGDLWGFAVKRLMGLGMAMAVGGALLVVSAVTREGIGMGDGWFFVVSGVFLGPGKNLLLLAGGLVLCFLVCSVLMVKGILTNQNIRRLSIPFLPFLLPAGIGVIFL